MISKAIAGLIVVAALFGVIWKFAWPFPSATGEMRLPGTVEVQEVRLSSKIGGRVKATLVVEGTLAEADQPLVELEVPELRAQRAQLDAELAASQAKLEMARNGPRPEELKASESSVRAAQARLERLRAGSRPEEIEHAAAEVAALEADLERANLDLQRLRTLIASKAVSSQEYDAARAAAGRMQGTVNAGRARLRLLEAGSRPEEIREAEAELSRMQANYELLKAGTRGEEIASAEASVRQLEARQQELDVNLSEAVIRAPERVVVEVVSVRRGDMVSPNQPVVRVLRAEDLWVKAFVSEVNMGKIRIGQEVEVTCDTFPAKRFQGTISYIASTSEFTPRNVQTYDERRHQVFAIKVLVRDPDGVFKSGMAAEVWLRP